MQVQVLTSTPSLGPIDVERLVTTPVELAMAVSRASFGDGAVQRGGAIRGQAAMLGGVYESNGSAKDRHRDGRAWT